MTLTSTTSESVQVWRICSRGAFTSCACSTSTFGYLSPEVVGSASVASLVSDGPNWGCRRTIARPDQRRRVEHQDQDDEDPIDPEELRTKALMGFITTFQSGLSADLAQDTEEISRAADERNRSGSKLRQ